MAPKRSNSPSRLPDWLQELLSEIQRLRQDLFHQETSLREITSILLENQHLLRSRVQTSLATLTHPAQFKPNTTARQSTIRSRISRPVLNDSIKKAAIPIPRVTTPDPASINRNCWYHRQFGAASSNCIQPCAFVAPPAMPKAKSDTSKSFKIQPVVSTTNPAPPMQRVASIIRRPQNQPENKQPENSIKDVEDTDWNELMESENRHPRLSDSSSSSSSSSSTDSSSDDSQDEEHRSK